jgi:hypothetical protein
MTLDSILNLLVRLEVLRGKELIPCEQPHHGSCCCCQKCGQHYDDCVCEHNRILRALLDAESNEQTLTAREGER